MKQNYPKLSNIDKTEKEKQAYMTTQGQLLSFLKN